MREWNLCAKSPSNLIIRYPWKTDKIGRTSYPWRPLSSHHLYTPKWVWLFTTSINTVTNGTHCTHTTNGHLDFSQVHCAISECCTEYVHTYLLSFFLRNVICVVLINKIGCVLFRFRNSVQQPNHSPSRRLSYTSYWSHVILQFSTEWRKKSTPTRL